MPAEHDSANRLDELESRIAYQDATIDKLNEVVCRQWEAIERIRQEVQRLEQGMQQLKEREVHEPGDNLPPPHY